MRSKVPRPPNTSSGPRQVSRPCRRQQPPGLGIPESSDGRPGARLAPPRWKLAGGGAAPAQHLQSPGALSHQSFIALEAEPAPAIGPLGRSASRPQTLGTSASRLSAAPNLGLDHLAPAEAARWRRRLQETERPCGCKSGAALVLVALVAFPLWTFVVSGPPRTPLGVVLAVGIYAFVVVAAGVVGKVAGIVVGRWRHRHLRARLARRLVLARQAAEE
jgi:hypothetical protein